MPRGRPRKPTALHILEGTFRPTRHRNRIDAPTPAMKPSELTEDEQAKQKAEIAAFRQRLYGAAGPPDAGPRSGGNAKRIRW